MEENNVNQVVEADKKETTNAEFSTTTCEYVIRKKHVSTHKIISLIGIVCCVAIIISGILSIRGSFGICSINDLSNVSDNLPNITSHTDVQSARYNHSLTREDLMKVNITPAPEYNVAVAANNAGTAAKNAGIAAENAGITAENSAISNQLLSEILKAISTLTGICLIAIGTVGALYFSLKLSCIK